MAETNQKMGAVLTFPICDIWGVLSSVVKALLVSQCQSELCLKGLLAHFYYIQSKFNRKAVAHTGVFTIKTGTVKIIQIRIALSSAALLLRPQTLVFGF